MLTTRSLRMEWELLKWALILTLAGALAWLLVPDHAAGWRL